MNWARANAILLDADIGNIYVNPSPDVVRQFNESNRAKTKIEKVTPAITGPKQRTARGYA